MPSKSGTVSGGNLHSLAREFKKRPELDNNPEAFTAKVDVRKRVLALLGADRAHVLDLFAGSGRLHRAVWKDAASYVGCDERFFWDARSCYVVDNRLLLRAIDLAPYTVFDMDAYGSPWECALIVARRRRVAKGERIGIVMTEGSSTKMKFGSLPKAMAELARTPMEAAGISRAQWTIFEQAIVGLVGAMNCAVVKRWEARGRTGSRVVYLGMVLEGLGGTPVQTAARVEAPLFEDPLGAGSAAAGLR
jgi:hypothetical protein